MWPGCVEQLTFLGEGYLWSCFFIFCFGRCRGSETVGRSTDFSAKRTHVMMERR